MRATVIVLAVVGIVIAIAVLLVDPLRDGPSDQPRDTASPTRGTPVTPVPPLPDDVDLGSWAERTARPIGLPARALSAYGAAELRQAEATPDCGVSWTTLAAIGRVESDHGRLGRADLDADGVARPPVVGVALDGGPGLAEIGDTDGGRLDGDREHDRAVGPMQFLPTTWARHGVDGDGDGVRDPHDLDDAAAGAAAYLCTNGRDVTDGDDWWSGVLTYNRSVDYARRVWAAADRYAGAVAP
jgi:membrane-bound lytic murein transglycosylase B